MNDEIICRICNTFFNKRTPFCHSLMYGFICEACRKKWEPLLLDAAFKAVTAKIDFIKGNSILNKDIRDLEMTNRSTNCLICNKIDTVQELLRWSEHDLLKTPRLGKKSLHEIKNMLKSHGLCLKSKVKR